jgi:hypothetical protein
MADFNNYSPDKVKLNFNGLIINGYANDTFIEVERDEDGFMKYTGALGDVARSRNLNKGGKVTVTLMAVSPINDKLYELAAIDEDDGTAYGPLQISDLSGTMRCHAEIAWVQKWPKIDRGKESGTIQWVFDCADIEIIPGGNVI